MIGVIITSSTWSWGTTYKFSLECWGRGLYKDRYRAVKKGWVLWSSLNWKCSHSVMELKTVTIWLSVRWHCSKFTSSSLITALATSSPDTDDRSLLLRASCLTMFHDVFLPNVDSRHPSPSPEITIQLAFNSTSFYWLNISDSLALQTPNSRKCWPPQTPRLWR